MSSHLSKREQEVLEQYGPAMLERRMTYQQGRRKGRSEGFGVFLALSIGMGIAGYFIGKARAKVEAKK